MDRTCFAMCLVLECDKLVEVARIRDATKVTQPVTSAATVTSKQSSGCINIHRCLF